jgi:hypothetical protein
MLEGLVVSPYIGGIGLPGIFPEFPDESEEYACLACVF